MLYIIPDSGNVYRLDLRNVDLFVLYRIPDSGNVHRLVIRTNELFVLYSISDSLKYHRGMRNAFVSHPQ